MATRGLPGFLRRSRRSDDYEDDDDDDEEEVDEIEKTPGGINNNNNIDRQQQQQQQQSHHQIPMKQQQEATTSLRENSYGFIGGAGSATSSSLSFSEELKNERQNNYDDNIIINDDNNNNNEKRNRRGKLMGTTTSTSTSLNNYDSIVKTKTTAGRSSLTTTSSVGNNNNNNNNNKDNNNDDDNNNDNNHDNNNKDNNNNNKSQQDNNNTTTATTTSTTHNRPTTMIMERKYSYRETQFDKIIKADVVQMSELRKLGWNGIPPEHRAMAWKILLGYLPTNKQRRTSTLDRKRAEYKDTIRQHYDIPDDSRTIQEQETLRQVLVDVPRTAPEIPLFRNERIKRALGRLLYIWAIRHPASSYVQGINDLATPLFCVFLSDYYNGQDVQDGNVMVVISDERLQEVEADVYWCLTNILAGIQDHYTADQPGVQRMVMRLEELVRRIDSNLCEHFTSTGIQFMQFAFKWMNCLLLREFNLNCVIRLWDTYISEDQNGSSSGGFENFHVYVCAAFLCQFSQPLQEMGFDELFGFMQEVPTDDWGETEIEMLLSQAYVLSTLFGGSDAHLTSNT